MLPNPQNEPACRLELRVMQPVPRHVGFELDPPPIRVGLWQSRVLRTRMPEAPVHEDRDPFLREDEVRSALRDTWQRHIQPVTQASAV